MAPLTTRTGCSSSWRKVKPEDPNYKRFPDKHAPTVLTVNGDADYNGCGAIDVSVYGTGQPMKELEELDTRIATHMHGLKLDDDETVTAADENVALDESIEGMPTIEPIDRSKYRTNAVALDELITSSSLHRRRKPKETQQGRARAAE